MWSWGVAASIIVMDQWTKRLVTRALSPGQGVPVLPPLVQLTYVQNTGAAFGMLKGQQTLFIWLSVAVIGWILWQFAVRPPQSRTVSWSLGLVLGGAAGNLIDRLQLGYVIDFIALPVWPVFNVADSAITIGVFILLLAQVGPFRRFRLVGRIGRSRRN